MPLQVQQMSVEEGIGRYDGVHPGARAWLTQAGVGFDPNRPGSSMAGSPTLVAMDENQLGEELNRMGKWAEFLRPLQVSTKVEMDSARTKLEFITAKTRLSIRDASRASGTRPTVDEIRDMTVVDPRVVRATEEFLQKEATHAYVKTAVDMVERNWATVSRRITQLTDRQEMMTRRVQFQGVRHG